MSSVDAVKYNLKIEQGADWSKDWLLANVDDTPYPVANITAAVCQFKQFASPDSAVAVELTKDSGIVFDADTGKMTLQMSVDQTWLLKHNKMVYDILLTIEDDDGTLVYKPLRGDVQVVFGVTRNG